MPYTIVLTPPADQATKYVEASQALYSDYQPSYLLAADGSSSLHIMDPLPLMSTDPLMAPEQIIELYVDRWSIEVMFEETREHLGVETQHEGLKRGVTFSFFSDRSFDESTSISKSSCKRRHPLAGIVPAKVKT